jgi:RTA1 like protein
MTGICLQVVTLLIFGFLAGLYARNVYNSRSSLPARAYETIQNSSFRTFVYAMSAAYLFILIRCIYRIGEMAGGWKNKISRNQTDFMVLDGLYVVPAYPEPPLPLSLQTYPLWIPYQNTKLSHYFTGCASSPQ